MELARERFVKFLLEYQFEEYQKYRSFLSENYLDYIEELSLLKQNLIIIKNLIRVFKIDKNEWVKYKELFNDFMFLSAFLLKSPLSDSEKTSNVFYIIEKNISTGILDDNTRVIDPRKVKKYEFENYTKQEVESLFSQRKFTELDSSSKLKYLEGVTYDSKELVNLHRLMVRHYFTKQENFTEEDVIQIQKTLIALSLDPQIVSSVVKTLNKKRQKNLARIEREKKIEIFSSDKTINNNNLNKDNRLRNREYKKIERELKDYFNLETKKIPRTLTEEEIIYGAYLMLKLSITEDIIINFCQLAIKENQKKLNPLALYSIIYNSIQYYQEKHLINIDTDSLKNYFKEIFIASDEDYVFWKKEIQEELDKIIEKLSPKHEYEIEEAKRLQKHKK